MYVTGSFIVAMALLGTTAMTQLNGIPNQAGQKTKEYFQEENKILKVFTLFLLFFALIMVITKFSNSR